MVIKVYTSSISGNSEVKKHQQHALFVLAGHSIDFREIDIADPSNESEKELMSKNSQPNAKGYIIPPQFFNDEIYCGVRRELNLSNLFNITICI